MKSLTLKPRSHVNGEIFLPGSKSLSNRALLLSALAEGTTELTNLLTSDDTQRMIEALTRLGTRIDHDSSNHTCTIEGHHGPFPRQDKLELYLGNAGTAIRSLTAAIALTDIEVVLTGDEQMQVRPIQHLVDALRQAGARLDYLGNDGYPPVKVSGGTLVGGEISIPGNVSSQFLTALLMVLPLARSDSEIHVIGEQVSKPYLDITLNMINRFGGAASHDNYQSFHVPGSQHYTSPGSLMIEGDASSATYFLAAAAIKGGTVRVHGIGTDSIQGDAEFADVLEKMGAKVTKSDAWIEVTKGELNGVDLDLNHIPDAAMTVATTALFAKGKTRIRNIYNWRVKETDRIKAMSTELKKLGATVKSGEDYIEITPPDAIQATEIDTYGDHRMAMGFSLAALGTVSIVINDPDCTSKTFPDYFSEFDKIAL